MAVRADDVDLVRDRSLVELCQAGDEAAFGDLYARYYQRLLRFCVRHGWSYQQIADHYNVTMGTVEALLFRARKALRREFLALAGPDARLASLPVFGVMWRLAARMRMRLNDVGSHLAPAAAAGAMG